MKKFLPPALKLYLRIVLRSILDWRSGQRKRFVKSTARRATGPEWGPQFSLSQALKSASYAENKRHNLVQAAGCINQLVIEPGNVFSFWALVGQPSARKGYLQGRSLVGGRLQAEWGGGLCQLSGLIYYVALKAGLEIVERYPHSVDIYTDETRFTPLGSDATVVYGYKDLRVVNNLSHSIAFNVRVEVDEVVGELWATKPVAVCEMEFETTRRGTEIEVVTVRRSSLGLQTDVINTSRYQLPETMRI